MARTPEPQLMEDMEQARAYAYADFEEPHNHFIELIKTHFPGEEFDCLVLDLGCGAADICRRFADAFPKMRMHAIDGSEAMLHFARITIDMLRLHEQVRLFKRTLPTDTLPQEHYSAIICNSLLHHLDDPQVLWQTIKQFAAPGAPIVIMDLMRPQTEAQVESLTSRYAGNEPEVLKREFRNSLHAAYTPEEVTQQLAVAGLGQLQVKVVSDRHLLVYGNR
ncbi:MAG: class I SAM-dependent methyltransferase [Gammaproteobacteria bacterium]|nr:class I SAM-dependent methyltransferase [Gammaproteobacteria bacterium]